MAEFSPLRSVAGLYLKLNEASRPARVAPGAGRSRTPGLLLRHSMKALAATALA